MRVGAEGKYLFIQTFGCQMNDHDSQKITHLLENYDYKLTLDPEKADVIIVNSCSIREKAEQKLYSTLGRFKRFKAKKRKLIIGVGGCVAQQERDQILKKLPYVDIVFGTHAIHRLPYLISSVEEKRNPIVDTCFFEKGKELFLAHPVSDGVKAYVSVMQGCNNFCTYCIVPYVRGSEVTRKSESILREIEELVAKGVKEVTLLGQNVNSYGIGIEGELSFPELIRKIAKVEGLERVRFTTSHPKDLSEALMECLAEVEKLCEHFHLPLQSGSDFVLQRMNRCYTKDEYLEKVRRLEQYCPKIAITSDIIVGFPGEKEEDFLQTLEMIEKIRFDNIFSFRYSARPGTKASSFPDMVDEETKQRRLEILQSLQRKITFEKNRELEGATEKVLVEGKSKTGFRTFTGRTSTNKVVNFLGWEELVGKIVLVRITKAYQNSLEGQLVLR